LDIGASALFNVNRFQVNHGADRKVDLGMMYGTLRASVTKKIDPIRGRFRVHTPSATMGVRGTEFVIKTDVAQIRNLGAAAQAADGQGGGSVPIAQSASAQAPVPPKTEVVVIQGKVDVQTHLEKPLSGSRSPASLRALSSIVSL